VAVATEKPNACTPGLDHLASLACTFKVLMELMTPSHTSLLILQLSNSKAFEGQGS
jgi:hypothetical protein